jgi:hypothetical protein
MRLSGEEGDLFAIHSPRLPPRAGYGERCGRSRTRAAEGRTGTPSRGADRSGGTQARNAVNATGWAEITTFTREETGESVRIQEIPEKFRLACSGDAEAEADAMLSHSGAAAGTRTAAPTGFRRRGRESLRA